MKCKNCGYDSEEPTKRELEVEALLIEGLRIKAVAERLGISPRTADAHRTHLYRKRGVHGQVELIKKALLAQHL